MRAFLIDSENVNFDNFIKANKFKKKDHFYIVGNATLKFSLFALKFLQGRKVKFYDFNEPSKDYADKIILTLLGFLLAQKKFKKCLIVSNDNIFAKHNFTRDFFGNAVKIVKINNEQSPKITLKSDYHIQLYEKNEAFIKNLHAQSRNLGDFHRALQKHYKIHGTLIYKYLKENRKDEYFTPQKRSQVPQLAHSPRLLMLKNERNFRENLGKFGENFGNSSENGLNLGENLGENSRENLGGNSRENSRENDLNLGGNSRENLGKSGGNLGENSSGNFSENLGENSDGNFSENTLNSSGNLGENSSENVLGENALNKNKIAEKNSSKNEPKKAKKKGFLRKIFEG